MKTLGLFILILTLNNFCSCFRWPDVKSLIKSINDADTTWKAGENFQRGSVPISKRNFGSRPQPRKTLPEAARIVMSGPLPTQFDARKQWPNCPSIGRVLDQGACGSCWAVASTSVFTDRICIASQGKDQSQISAHYLLHCCGTMCGGAGCDSGGDDYRAWVYFRTRGIVTGGPYNSSEGCMPYEYEPCEHYHIQGPRPDCYKLPPPGIEQTCHAKCTNPSYGKTIQQDLYKVSKSYKVMRNQNEIMKEIYTNGPVQAGITVYEDLPVYKSGIYKYTTGNKVGDHSVKLIGWGVEKGVPYWLAVNSWNTDWGDEGLFKILRGSNNCHIEETIHAGIPILHE